MRTVRSLWQVLIVLALIGCLASLFGPTERRWGVDVGAVGSSVFSLALLASVILVSVWPRDAFPDHWSLAESRAWVGLIFTALLLCGFTDYLLGVAALEEVPRTFHDLPRHQFYWLLGVVAVAWGVTSGVLALRGGPALDERDLRLRHQADRLGDWALSLLIIACVVLLNAVPAARLDWWLEPVILANVLVGVLMTKLLVEHAALAFGYALARR